MLVGLGALLLAGLLFPLPAQAQGPPLEARNLDPTVQPGDTAVVRLTIGSGANPVGEVNGVGFQLAFDNNALSFIDRQVGALFAPEHPGNTLEIGPTLDGSAVDYSITLGFGATPPTVTSGEVARLRFEVKSGAATGSSDFTLSDASRATSTNPNIPINNLVHGSVTVSETRRAERASVAPGSVTGGTEEVQFGDGGQLALDYSSLNAETEVEATRIAEPLGGSTDLPNGSGGTPLQRALLDYWTLGQTGASSFTADVCLKLSDLIVSVPDPTALDVYKRASGSDPWQDPTTELRPSASSPTKICALDVGSFSQFAVTAPRGHSRTIEGTDGTGNDTGWRSLALPVSAERISLEDDFDFDVDSGALVQTYDNGQYAGVTDPKTTLERGEGFMLYVFDDAVDTVPGSGRTLDLPESDESQSTTVTTDGLGQSDRFHFLGNPYDVKYSLDALAGGDLSTEGFQQSVQVWDPIPQPGQFDVVTQGVGDDSIAAWQSFFVQRSTVGAGQTDLTFDPGGRGDSAGDLRGTGRAKRSTLAQAAVRLDLQVTAESETVARDGLTLLFDERAEAGWDGLEASQLAPPAAATYATLSSPLLRGDDLVRRALASEPYPTENGPTGRPVSVRSVQATGTATLRWPEGEREALPAGWDVELVDTEADSTVDLRATAYSFPLEEGDGTVGDPGDARFELRVTATTIPVELAGLEATRTGEGVQLRWQTASETGNAGFYVQRKQVQGTRGGAQWQDLGFVESKAGGGTTSEPTRYRFRDADLPYAADSLVYRLRQVDTDGTAEITGRAVVQLGAPERLALEPPVPNPASRRATLRFGVPAATEVTVAVYDLLGRQVATPLRGRLEAGRHETPLPAASLAPGVYFVRLQAEGTARTQKLTVVR